MCDPVWADHRHLTNDFFPAVPVVPLHLPPPPPVATLPLIKILYIILSSGRLGFNNLLLSPFTLLPPHPINHIACQVREPRPAIPRNARGVGNEEEHLPRRSSTAYQYPQKQPFPSFVWRPKMATRTKVLVVGATGETGGSVTNGLLDDGHFVS